MGSDGLLFSRSLPCDNRIFRKPDAVPLSNIKLIVQLLILNEWKQLYKTACPRHLIPEAAIGPWAAWHKQILHFSGHGLVGPRPRRRKYLVNSFVIQLGRSNLFQIITAQHPPPPFPRTLDPRH